MSMKKPRDERSKPVTITIPRGLHRAAKGAAMHEGCSFSQMVSNLISAYLKYQSKKA